MSGIYGLAVVCRSIFFYMEEKKSTSEVINEKATWCLFGWLPFRLKPLTLSQIWEIGELVQKCDKLDLQGEFYAIERMLAAHGDLKHLQNIVVKAVFRSSIARFLFGWYIRKHTTMKVYKRVISFCAKSFDAPFFFQSLTFLRGAKKVTMNTHEAQVRGDLSEE